MSDLIFYSFRVYHTVQNILVESVGIHNLREIRNSDSMVRLGTVGCLPVHAVFHLSQVRQMGGRTLTIPPRLTILGRGYAMNIP